MKTNSKKVAEAIFKASGITIEQLRSELRINVPAFRYVYALVRRQQGATLVEIAKELNRKHSTIIAMLKVAYPLIFSNENAYKTYLNVIAKFGLPNHLLKMLGEEKERLQKSKKAKEQKTIRYTFNKDCPKAKKIHGFNIDDDLIERACQQAEKFFETYGKGQKQIAPIIEHPECYNG